MIIKNYLFTVSYLYFLFFYHLIFQINVIKEIQNESRDMDIKFFGELILIIVLSQWI